MVPKERAHCGLPKHCVFFWVFTDYIYLPTISILSIPHLFIHGTLHWLKVDGEGRQQCQKDFCKKAAKFKREPLFRTPSSPGPGTSRRWSAGRSTGDRCWSDKPRPSTERAPWGSSTKYTSKNPKLHIKFLKDNLWKWIFSQMKAPVPYVISMSFHLSQQLKNVELM